LLFCQHRWQFEKIDNPRHPNMPNVIDRLVRALPELPRKLAFAARYAIDNPDRIALDSMRTAAANCNVASPTMLRLARHIGFDSYDNFRAEFQNRLLDQGFGPRVDALRSDFPQTPDGALATGISDAARYNISSATARLTPSDITAFTTAVHSGGRMHVIGAGSMYWLAGIMESVGTMITPALVANAQGTATMVERIATLPPDDSVLVIAVAPYSRLTIDAIRHAKDGGLKVFAITDRQSSPLVALADIVFFAPTTSIHYYPSLVSVMLVIEILLAAVAAAGDETCAQRLQAVDQARHASGAYLD
jgi:DNA-binding MurR/RpiR family transcriptional regulator